MKFRVDGHDAYVYTGSRTYEAAQPSVVFVHGGGLDHTVWNLQSRYLAHHGYNALAVDLPGHGASAGAPLASIGEMADWVARVLDALAAPAAAVVGHSMGSLVALETAARYPQRIWLLVMIGTSVPMPVTDRLLDAARADDHAAFDMVNAWGHGLRAQIGGNQAPGMWMSGGGIRLLERSGPGVLYADLKACNDYVDGLESAARVRCPAHLVLGEQDLMSPVRASRDLAATLPQVRITQIAASGHMLMAERPNEVLDALLDALRAGSPPVASAASAASAERETRS